MKLTPDSYDRKNRQKKSLEVTKMPEKT